MKQSSHKIFSGLFFAFICGLSIPHVALGQTEKLGIVQYTPPRGWTRTAKVENVVAFSDIKQSGVFCIVTLYGATNGTGNPAGDFTREWNNLVAGQMKADENPKPDTQSAEGWTILSGGSPVVADTGKALAFLTVISGFGQTVSVLAVFNDPAYVKQVDDFVSALELDKPAAPAKTSTAPAPAAVDGNGKLIIPLPTRQLTVADLAGEWGEGDSRIATAYYSANTGDYVGTDRLAFRTKHAITQSGGYLNDFFEIRNGRKLSDKTTGTVAINGSVFSIVRGKSISKYVIRGWLELPDATLMKITGPWYDGEIPPQVFTSLEHAANLDSIWVRKK